MKEPRSPPVTRPMGSSPKLLRPSPAPSATQFLQLSPSPLIITRESTPTPSVDKLWIALALLTSVAICFQLAPVVSPTTPQNKITFQNANVTRHAPTQWSTTAFQYTNEGKVIAFPQQTRHKTKHAKYLTYSPHGGLHNQRSALNNAIVLSKLLNRTLIIPPVRLGKALHWYPGERMLRTLHRDERRKLSKQCRDQLPDREAKGRKFLTDSTDKCYDYPYYTLASWSTLFSFESLPVPVIERSSFAQEWLHMDMGISEKETYQFLDQDRYSIQFVDDTEKLGKQTIKYASVMEIEELARLPFDSKRLLEIGSLFGHSRLTLSDPKHLKLQEQVLLSTFITNDEIRQASDEIVGRLGGTESFVGMHLRLGDGHFKTNAHEYVHTIVERLLKEGFGYSKSTITSLKQSVNLIRQLPAKTPRFIGDGLQCHGRLWTDQALLPLNKPLFLATDVKAPLSDPKLKPLTSLFPCLFVLGDFQDIIEPIAALRSDWDEVRIGQFLLPLIDATVAAHASYVTGHYQSTFFGYIKALNQAITTHAA